MTPESVQESSTLSISVDVTNEGLAAAEETVFLFTHDKVATVARPLLELKGCGKVSLEPGATRTVELQLAAAELRFLGQDLSVVFEPGEVEILVGPSADRTYLMVANVQLR